MSKALFILWRNPINEWASSACDSFLRNESGEEDPFPDGLHWLQLMIGLIQLGLFSGFITLFVIYTKVVGISLLITLLFAPGLLFLFLVATLMSGIICVGCYIENKVNPKPDRYHKR